MKYLLLFICLFLFKIEYAQTGIISKEIAYSNSIYNFKFNLDSNNQFLLRTDSITKMTTFCKIGNENNYSIPFEYIDIEMEKICLYKSSTYDNILIIQSIHRSSVSSCRNVLLVFLDSKYNILKTQTFNSYLGGIELIREYDKILFLSIYELKDKNKYKYCKRDFYIDPELKIIKAIKAKVNCIIDKNKSIEISKSKFEEYIDCSDCIESTLPYGNINVLNN